MRTWGGVRVYALSAAVFAAAFTLGAIAICGFVEDAPWCGLWPRLAPGNIRRLILDAGPWGVAVSIGLMVVHSFLPFPSELITITNGMVYGVLWGTVISWTGGMLGAYAAFGLSRALGQEYVQRYLRKENLLRFQRVLNAYGAEAIFLCRFIPVVSFNLLNYAAGLTRMSWWTFTWTTGIGMLPVTVLMAAMGTSIHKLSPIAWAGLLALGLLLWWVIHRIYAKRLQPKE